MKQTLEYNPKEEQLHVVKSEEGRFYSIRFHKPNPTKSILKKRDSESITDKSSVVNFDFNDNEIRDFNKNDKLDLKVLDKHFSGKISNIFKAKARKVSTEG